MAAYRVEVTDLASVWLYMYTVHMPRFTVTEARKQLFRLLDSAEKGEEVILERRGTRFRLMLDPGPKSGDQSIAPLNVTDEEVLSGEWTWTAGAEGKLQFQARKKAGKSQE